MFQRQLELAEEHGLPTHEAVPFRVAAASPSAPAALPVGAPAPHEVRTMHLPHHHSVSIATPGNNILISRIFLSNFLKKYFDFTSFLSLNI